MKQQQRQPTIGIFTSSYGHTSISEAATQTLQDLATIATFKEDDLLFRFYTPMYQYFPSSPKLSFELSKNKPTLQALTRYFKLRYDSPVEAFFIEHQPKVCINACYMFNPAISRFSKIARSSFVNLVTDPRTIHPMLLDTSADLTLAFDDRAVETIAKINPDVSAKAAGWLVRNEYEEAYVKKQVRSELELEDTQTILIVSGSEGTNAILKILPAFLDTPSHLQIIVACGDNNLLYKSVMSMKTIAERLGNNIFLPLQYTTQLHKYMQAADLIVGKAGPNTLFEAVATHTPFVAVTHISGQEDGNLDIIREYKLGFVEENSLKAIRLLRNLAANPDQYQQLSAHLKSLAKYNHGCKKVLRQEVKQLLGVS